MSDYIPNTEAQQQEMLADIGMTKQRICLLISAEGSLKAKAIYPGSV